MMIMRNAPPQDAPEPFNPVGAKVISRDGPVQMLDIKTQHVLLLRLEGAELASTHVSFQPHLLLPVFFCVCCKPIQQFVPPRPSFGPCSTLQEGSLRTVGRLLAALASTLRSVDFQVVSLYGQGYLLSSQHAGSAAEEVLRKVGHNIRHFCLKSGYT